MPPVIHCVRHGQGFHNLGAGNYKLPDPKLTPLGEEQCVAVRERLFPDQSHISLITASPLLRAIESAFLIFQPSLECKQSPKAIVALPDAQETSDDPCDIGSNLEVLKNASEENNWPVDLSLVQDGWNIKKIGGRYSPASSAIENRARDLRIFLRQQARNLIVNGDHDANLVLVAHGGLLHYFTEDWENADLFPGTGWINCEARSYIFEHGVDVDDDLDAHLVETMDSRQRRGLRHPMISKETQKELFQEAMQGWEAQGLQNPSKL